MSVALYHQRRAELVTLIGEDKVREMELKLMDDYIIYGARKEPHDPAGVLRPQELKGLFG
jgi:hypothetical protein